jgi:hypothetical protein
MSRQQRRRLKKLKKVCLWRCCFGVVELRWVLRKMPWGNAIQVKESRLQPRGIAPGEINFDDIRKLCEFIELTLDFRRSCNL